MKGVPWTLRTFAKHLSKCCWIDGLGHALRDINIFDFISFEMIGRPTDQRTYQAMIEYYEWLYNQAREYPFFLTIIHSHAQFFYRCIVIPHRRQPLSTTLPLKIWELGFHVLCRMFRFLIPIYPS